jgi:hypothetical protein
VSAASTPDALTLQFLAWIDAAPRTREDVLDVWQTSCPRLSIFEDALGAGLIAYRGRPARLVVTELGSAALGPVSAVVAGDSG